jgi:hypothetical protein
MQDQENVSSAFSEQKVIKWTAGKRLLKEKGVEVRKKGKGKSVGRLSMIWMGKSGWIKYTQRQFYRIKELRINW